MSLNKKILVDLPKKVIFRDPNKNGVKYAYYATETFRDKNNKPTCKRVCIGKLDSDTNKLIPNQNYFSIFQDSEVDVTRPKTVKELGVSVLFNKISKDLSLDVLLEEANFSSANVNNILAVSQFFIDDTSILHYLDDYLDKVYFEKEPLVSSKSSSSFFKNINFDLRDSFFKLWIDKTRMLEEYWAYDVTSISSYSKNIPNLEYGYNRDGEFLEQINLAMYYGQESKLPLFYVTYAGSITDVAFLPKMMDFNADYDIKEPKFVLDKGFCSTNNLKILSSNDYKFIVGSKMTKPIKELVNRNIGKLNKNINYINNYDLYAISENITAYEIPLYAHLYYDEKKAHWNRTAIRNKINKDKEELEYLKKSIQKRIESNKKVTKKSDIIVDKKTIDRLSTYYKITISDDNSIEYIVDNEAVDEATSKVGYFVLLTNDAEKSSAKTLEIYRRKECVENAYDNLKNSIDMKRLHTHTKETSAGKIFVGFISLIFKSYIETKLFDYLKSQKTSVEKVLRSLKKIELVERLDGKRTYAPLTKEQRTILKLFDITEESIESYINQ